MTPLCLDSSTIIHVLRAKPDLDVRRRLQAALARPDPVWVSSVVVHELMTGALKSDCASVDLQRVDDLLVHLNIAEFNVDDAIGAARVRSDLEKRGAKIGPLDTLIAGQALTRDWALVTSDLGHFLRVEGLTVIDWTRSDEPLDRPNIVAQMLRARAKDPK